jgi:hypothetical protein
MLIVEETEFYRQIPYPTVNADKTEVITLENGKELTVERYEHFPEEKANEVLDLLFNKLCYTGLIAYFDNGSL